MLVYGLPGNPLMPARVNRMLPNFYPEIPGDRQFRFAHNRQVAPPAMIIKPAVRTKNNTAWISLASAIAVRPPAATTMPQTRHIRRIVV